MHQRILCTDLGNFFSGFSQAQFSARISCVLLTGKAMEHTSSENFVVLKAALNINWNFQMFHNITGRNDDKLLTAKLYTRYCSISCIFESTSPFYPAALHWCEIPCLVENTAMNGITFCLAAYVSFTYLQTSSNITFSDLGRLSIVSAHVWTKCVLEHLLVSEQVISRLWGCTILTKRIMPTRVPE